MAGHDLAVLDDLVLEQPVGDLVEQVAMVGDQPVRAAVRLLGDLADLLVAALAPDG